MGLDMGLVWKNAKIIDVPQFVYDMCPFTQNPFYLIDDDYNDLHILYFNRYYSLREDIIAKTKIEPESKTTIGIEEVNIILEILLDYMNKKYWEDGHDKCKWDYEYIRKPIMYSICKLFWLINYMNTTKDPVELYWYDRTDGF